MSVSGTCAKLPPLAELEPWFRYSVALGAAPVPGGGGSIAPSYRPCPARQWRVGKASAAFAGVELDVVILGSSF